jgi:hypothetical protein
MADLLKSVGCAGGAAVITVTFIHPVDTVKTRLQVAGEAGRAGVRNYTELGIFGTIKTIAKEEGAPAFWKGVNAAWLREASYTSLRLGLYEPIKVAIGADAKDSPFLKKFAAASLSGAIGSVAGNPFDVLKTTLMANEKAGGSIVSSARALYTHQGLGGFYRGFQANIIRAMVLNGTKMGCYDTIKQAVIKSNVVENRYGQQAVAAMGAGFFMVCTVAPFDIIRTRLMNQPADAKLYSGFLDCAGKIVKNEGPTALWKGFIPIWSRFAPTTTLQLIIFEQLRSMIGMEQL